MSADRRLTVAYATPGELSEHSPNAWDEVLGVTLFSTIDRPLNLDVPVARVGAPPLGAAPALCEVWRAGGPLRSGHTGLVHHRGNGRYLFGCISSWESTGLDPADLADSVDFADVADSVDFESDAYAPGALAAVTRTAYSEMFGCLEALGCPHLLRVWNFLPEINRETGGVERYRQFNEARQEAFRAAGRRTKGQVPAACALGTGRGGPLSLCFLASTEPGIAIENPRQVAAYEYPPQYGEHSPVFSRAMLADANGVPLLFVSGTASIVGHRTLHAGDVAAQARETAANLRILIDTANERLGRAAFAAGDLLLKVFLRRRADLDLVAAELRAALAPTAPARFIEADICRADLSVEIEAVGVGRTAAAD